MAREARKTKREKKAKRAAIVPRAVFAAAVSIGVVPTLGACSSGPTMSVAAYDMGIVGVAARMDLGMDGGADAAPDMPFGVADLGTPDMPFAVAVPIDLGTDSGDSAVFSVAVLPDAAFSVAAPIDT